MTMLLTLFNVRLGWWLGNPGPSGGTTYGRSCPAFSIGPRLAAAIGFPSSANPYVYLYSARPY